MRRLAESPALGSSNKHVGGGSANRLTHIIKFFVQNFIFPLNIFFTFYTKFGLTLICGECVAIKLCKIPGIFASNGLDSELHAINAVNLKSV